jgi:four helix bundle protein
VLENDRFFMEKQYHKFYELDIWKEGYDLQKEIFEITLTFPKYAYDIVSQINRSTNSIIANIAESHGRFHFADKIRVLYISRGEIEETQSHIMVAVSRKYMTKQDGNLLIQRYENLKMKLNGYISSFRTKESQ